MNTAQVNDTRWVSVIILFLAGCTLSAHLGKFPSALPLLVEQFGLTLAQAGNLVSVYAVITATCGLLAGILVTRIGYIPFTIIGLGLPTLGSLLGTQADTVHLLMISRAMEGAGWIFGAVAVPTILISLSTAKDRSVVMGIWGAFVPVGSGMMLFLAPALQQSGGWQASWAAAAALSFSGVLAALYVFRNNADVLRATGVAQASDGSKRRHLRTMFAEVCNPQAIALVLCFLLYGFQYLAVTSFLPSLLVEQSGMTLPVASAWGAVVLVANAVGNMLSGWVLNKGIARYQVLAVAALLMGLMSCITLATVNPAIRICAAILMTSIGGFIPGTLFSTARLVASSAAVVGILIGFMLQGTGIGQLSGPIALSRAVSWTGDWAAGGWLMLLAGVGGACSALLLRDLPEHAD